MNKPLRKVFSSLSYLGFIISGIYGFFISLTIVNYVAGFWGIAIGLAIFPATFLAAPFYALIAWGDLFPLLVVYGGGILSVIFFVIGDRMNTKD